MSAEQKEPPEHISTDVIEEAKMISGKGKLSLPSPTTSDITRTGGKWQAFAGIIEKTPVVGAIFKLLKSIYAFAGVPGIICLVFGFGLASFLVYLGQMPHFLIAEKYRASSAKTSQPAEVRAKPTDVKVHSAKSIDWFTSHVYWLEREGDDLKGKNLIKDYMVNTVESEGLSATTKFNWVLEASPGFVISGWGFRVPNVGSSKFFEPLNAKRDSKTSDSISLEVPICEKGDRLLAVLRVSWKQDLKPTDFLSTFHSSIK